MEQCFQYLIAFPNESCIQGCFTQCLAKGYTLTIITTEVSRHTEIWHFERLTRRALSVCQSTAEC